MMIVPAAPSIPGLLSVSSTGSDARDQPRRGHREPIPIPRRALPKSPARLLTGNRTILVVPGATGHPDPRHAAQQPGTPGCAPEPGHAARARRRHRGRPPRRTALTRNRPRSSDMAHITAREQVSMFCCGRRWVGVDRAHCCRRTAGCGHVFDDGALWDRHRRRGRCLDPRSLGLIPTIDGIWLRALELSSA